MSALGTKRSDISSTRTIDPDNDIYPVPLMSGSIPPNKYKGYERLIMAITYLQVVRVRYNNIISTRICANDK